jgi:flagellar assembly factor FliW
MLAVTGQTATNYMQNPQSLVADTQGDIIETRFGRVRVIRDNPIIFSRGLLGIPNSQQFYLCDFPNEAMQQFKILQSLQEDSLAFITLPVDITNNLIERTDIEKACEDIGIPVKDVAILLVVSVHRSPNAVQLSVNARAPLLINAPQRTAVQYVFQHSRYKVQHMLEAQ